MITLYNGNMLEEIKNVADGRVDLLLTDPPYNISEKGANPEWTVTDPITGEKVNKNAIHNQRFDESFEENWDSLTEEEFLQQLQDWSNAWFPKLRKGAAFCVFISDRYISHLWSAMERSGFEPKRVWTWKKPAAVPFNRSVNPVSGAEYILWGIKPGGKRTFNADTVKGTMVERYSLADKVSSILYKHIAQGGELDDNFAAALKEAKKVIENLKTTGSTIHAVVPNTFTYSGGLGKDKIHPTQKPEEILKYFIELLTNEGDTILDTFAGSGSTGKAAMAMRRNAILIERDKKMFDNMAKRFNTTDDPTLISLFDSLFEDNQ